MPCSGSPSTPRPGCSRSRCSHGCGSTPRSPASRGRGSALVAVGDRARLHPARPGWPGSTTAAPSPASADELFLLSVGRARHHRDRVHGQPGLRSGSRAACRPGRACSRSCWPTGAARPGPRRASPRQRPRRPGRRRGARPDRGRRRGRAAAGGLHAPRRPAHLAPGRPAWTTTRGSATCRLARVPVVGTTDRLGELVAATGAEAVVIAIPSASTELVTRLRRQAQAAGASVKVLPATSQLLTDHVGIRDLRDINLTDVLGRNQLDTDIGAIAGYLTGRRVLVTGAGGSIGSELCRQIHRYGPAELMMLDRDESALHAVQLSIHGRALLDSGDVILCDIRDAARRPRHLPRPAARGRLPRCGAQAPPDARAVPRGGREDQHRRHQQRARRLRAGRGRPSSSTSPRTRPPTPRASWATPSGSSERLTATRAARTGGDYLSVRFGNVLGSRGSVLTSFAKQIAAGGPVTVTDPEVTRYFMTIEEACQLVIQSAAIGRPGEALVLDMGEPVRIADMARQLIELDGGGVDIVYTGLRAGREAPRGAVRRHRAARRTSRAPDGLPRPRPRHRRGRGARAAVDPVAARTCAATSPS